MNVTAANISAPHQESMEPILFISLNIEDLLLCLRAMLPAYTLNAYPTGKLGTLRIIFPV